jgi:hypothetical protein
MEAERDVGSIDWILAPTKQNKQAQPQNCAGFWLWFPMADILCSAHENH